MVRFWLGKIKVRVPSDRGRTDIGLAPHEQPVGADCPGGVRAVGFGVTPTWIWETKKD